VGREKAVAATINRIRRDRVAIFRLEPNSSYSDGEILSEDVVPPFPSTIALKVHNNCFGGQYASQYQQGRMQEIADIYAGAE
jgi:hypothetical protein